MRKVLLGAVVAATISAFSAPAAAQSYNAYTGFTGNTDQTANGVNNGNFIYGEVDGLGNVGSFFNSNTNCALTSVCLQDNPGGNPAGLPGVYKNTGPAYQDGTVLVPSNKLIIHPDDDSDQTFIAFVAPTAGIYRLFANFTVQDTSPTGVVITRIGTTNGGPPITYGQSFNLDGNSGPVSDFQLVSLGASEAIGYGIGNGGVYFNDSTGVSFQVFAGVPEASTWALMILGIGAVGGALRRRRATVRTSVSYA